MTPVMSCSGLGLEVRVKQQGSEGVPICMTSQWSCDRARPDAPCFGFDCLDGWGTPVPNEATAIGGRLSAKGVAPGLASWVACVGQVTDLPAWWMSVIAIGACCGP